jgi:hypothetical protein
LLPIIVITARPDQYPLAVAAGVGALMEKPLGIIPRDNVRRKRLDGEPGWYAFPGLKPG